MDSFELLIFYRYLITGRWRKNRYNNECELVTMHCSGINKWMLNYSQLS